MKRKIKIAFRSFSNFIKITPSKEAVLSPETSPYEFDKEYYLKPYPDCCSKPRIFAGSHPYTRTNTLKL